MYKLLNINKPIYLELQGGTDMTKKLDPDVYNRRVQERHGGSIILLSKYIKSGVMVDAMCTKCGYKFSILPHNLLLKQQPCNVCSGLLDKKKSKQTFLNEKQSEKYKLYKIEDIWEYSAGIYFIFNKDKVLCNVGKTKNIRMRLLNHIKNNSEYIYANYILIADPKERSEAEVRLINILKPLDNYWDVYSYNFTRIPKNKFREDNKNLYENKLAREISEERSGIIFVFDQNDNLLYINKAKNIMKEINKCCKNDLNYYANYIVIPLW